MKTLEEFWTDPILTKKVQQLRDKLPDFFSHFSNSDLILAWVKFSGGFSQTWPVVTRAKVNKFVTQLNISEEDLEEDFIEDPEEEEEPEIEEVDFETPRFPDDDDYERDF